MSSQLIQEKVNLIKHTTFGVNAIAKTFSSFHSVDELKNLLASQPDPLLILGGGSNLLFTQDFPGLVLKNDIKGIDIFNHDDEKVILKVGAGEVWHEFVLYAVENGFGGIENLSLIPGNVGASPIQNIGAYGVEIKDVFEKLEAVEIKTGLIHTFSSEDCRFGYRESVFKHQLKNQFVITSVYFKLTKKHLLNTKYGSIEEELKAQEILNPTIKDVSNAVIAIRRSKLPDPKELGYAGSFFKNPVIQKTIFKELEKAHPSIPNFPQNDLETKIPAGWLIETAGWKGKIVGNCGVHAKQALVIVNYGNASGEEIHSLSNEIIKDIKQKFNIELEREVNII